MRPQGLYCPPGDFYIDPWRPVDRAVITHAHGDHARGGSARYLAAQPSMSVLRQRLGDVALDTLAYGARIRIRDTTVSLHPAGHVLGSAQVRIEHRGETWVVSGDYKLAPDPTCDAFEPLRCETTIEGLEVIQGAIPEGLEGTLYRVGADWQYPSKRTDDIFIDGEGSSVR